MNRKVLLIAALTLLVPAAAHAQLGPRMSLVVNGGLTSPTGEFGEDVKSGYNLGAGLFFGFTDMLALGVEGSWHRKEHEGVGTSQEIPPGSGTIYTLEEDRFSILQLGATLRLNFATPTSPVRPHASVGLGMYNVREAYEYTVDDGFTVQRFTEEDDEADGLFEQIGSRLGAKFGLGAVFQASPRIGVGVDASYHIVTLDENEMLTPFAGERSLQFFGLHAGLVFDFSGGY